MSRENFFSELGKDFSNFADVLTKHNKSLEDISNKLYKLSGQVIGKSYYKVEPIIIFNELEKFPKKLSHKKSAINLKLQFDVQLEIDYNHLIKGRDPFSSFSFNIVITGKNKNNKSSKLNYAIHFDRHNIEEESEGNKPLQPHPIYHFQFGGNRLKDIDYGQALFLDSPRIMHHPMELILGIDFILSNFFPTIWNKIKNDKGYKKIVQKYQKYFVKPYFQSVANSFDKTLSQNWNAQEIYPQLIR